MKRPRLIVTAAALMVCAQAYAQSFPSRPIELVVHTGPGAGADRIARLIAEILTKDKLITQPMIVVNRTGGAGTVAFNYMKSKPGDPHYVLSSVGGTLLSASLRPEFNIYENAWMNGATFTEYMKERQAWVREFLKSIGATKS